MYSLTKNCMIVPKSLHFYCMVILYGKTVWCFCMVIFHRTDACPSPSAPSPHSLLTHLPPPPPVLVLVSVSDLVLIFVLILVLVLVLVLSWSLSWFCLGLRLGLGLGLRLPQEDRIKMTVCLVLYK